MTALGERGPARRVVVYQGVKPLHQSAMEGRDGAPLIFNAVLARTIPRCPRAPGSAFKGRNPQAYPRLGVLLFYSRGEHRSRPRA
jgi:hypothetical protein